MKSVKSGWEHQFIGFVLETQLSPSKPDLSSISADYFAGVWFQRIIASAINPSISPRAVARSITLSRVPARPRQGDFRENAT